MTHVPPDHESATAWLHDAYQESLRQLMAMQADLEGEHERQRVNARRLAIALYLMGRTSNQSVAIPPPQLGYPMAAIRRTLRSDAALMTNFFEVSEELRAAVAYVVERQRQGIGSAQGLRGEMAETHALTTSTVMAIAAWNQWLLQQPCPPQMDQVLVQLEQIKRHVAQRFSLLSLAPSTPEGAMAYWPLVGEDLPLPHEPLPTPRPNMTHEKKAAPSSEAVRLLVAPGSSICAVAEGTVAFVGPVRGLDEVVILAHEHGRLSVYALLEETLVRVGDQVGKGRELGRARSAAFEKVVPVIFEVREGERAAPPRLLLGDRDPHEAIVKH